MGHEGEWIRGEWAHPAWYGEVAGAPQTAWLAWDEETAGDEADDDDWPDDEALDDECQDGEWPDGEWPDGAVAGRRVTCDRLVRTWIAGWARFRSRVALARSSAVAGLLSRDAGWPACTVLLPVVPGRAGH